MEEGIATFMIYHLIQTRQDVTLTSQQATPLSLTRSLDQVEEVMYWTSTNYPGVQSVNTHSLRHGADVNTAQREKRMPLESEFEQSLKAVIDHGES